MDNKHSIISTTDSHLPKPVMNVDASRHAILLGKENEQPADYRAEAPSERPLWAKPLSRHTLQAATSKTVKRTMGKAENGSETRQSKTDNQALPEEDEPGKVTELLRSLLKEEQEVDAELEHAKEEKERLRITSIQGEKLFHEKEQKRIDIVMEERRKEKHELTQKIDAERERLSQLSDRLLELHNQCSRSVAMRTQKETILRKEELKSDQLRKDMEGLNKQLANLYAEQAEFNAFMAVKDVERLELSKLRVHGKTEVHVCRDEILANAQALESTQLSRHELQCEVLALKHHEMLEQEKKERKKTEILKTTHAIEEAREGLFAAERSLNDSKVQLADEKEREAEFLARKIQVEKVVCELEENNAAHLREIEIKTETVHGEHASTLTRQQKEDESISASLEACKVSLLVAATTQNEAEEGINELRNLLKAQKTELSSKEHRKSALERDIQAACEAHSELQAKGEQSAVQLAEKNAELILTQDSLQKLGREIEQHQDDCKEAERLDTDRRSAYHAEKKRLGCVIHELEQTQAIELNAFQSRQQEMLLRQRDALKDLHEAEKINEGIQRELDEVLNTVKETEKNLAALHAQIVEKHDETVHLESYAAQMDDLQMYQKARAKEYEIEIMHEEQQRRYLHNLVQELKGNIRVFCRVRPDLASPGEGVVSIDDSERALVVRSGTPDGKAKAPIRTAPVEKRFEFDRIFGQLSSQEDVFDEISQVVQSALDGYRVCLFAYGQTGSGKTHTMIGTKQHPGVIPRSVRKIFSYAETLSKQGWSFELQVAVLEIYNERVRDLLSSDRAQKCELKPRVDSSGYSVTNLTHQVVENERQVLLLLEQATKNRMTASTKMNEHSSRSHSIFRLFIQGKNRVTGQELDGALNLVDLAGSERLDKSGTVDKERREEAKFINLSLTTLNQCIMGLAQASGHIKYRDSKLTQLLQDSLGGDSKTVMFVNVSPVADNRQETLCSLQFGQSVNACEIGSAQRKTAVSFDDL